MIPLIYLSACLFNKNMQKRELGRGQSENPLHSHAHWGHLLKYSIAGWAILNALLVHFEDVTGKESRMISFPPTFSSILKI